MPDILLTPTNPISSSFHVEGLTCEGKDFIEAWFDSKTITGHDEMVYLKQMAWAAALTVETDWTCAGKAMAL